MHKTLLLASLLLAGCGGNAETDNAGPITGPSPVAPLTITTENAAIVSSSVGFLIIRSGGLDDELTQGSSLENIQASNSASAVAEIFNAHALFAAGDSRSVAGPSGGSAQITRAGNTTEVLFSDLAVNNVTLAGRVTQTRGPGTNAAATAVNCTFAGFEVSRNGVPAFRIDGEADVVQTRVPTASGGLIDRDTYTYRYLVTEPNGGTARVDVLAQDERDLGASGAVTRDLSNGTLTYSNFRALNGAVRLTNTQPFVYTFPPLTQIAGGSLTQGNGAIRRTVVAPNVIRTEVQPAGSGTFVPLAP